MVNKMKCAVWNGKEPKLDIEMWPIPVPKDDEILVKVAYAGICGSDIHIINNGLPRSAITPPKIIGHEFSGVVEQIGEKVTDIKEGERVSANPIGACGECFYCRNKMENYCEKPSSIIRGPYQGSIAEYVLVRSKQIYKLPEEMSLKKAVLLEPMSIAVHAIEKAELSLGDVVVVIGAGPIGLLIGLMAMRGGASKVIFSEADEGRREFAKTFGFNLVVDPSKGDLKQIVFDNSNGKGADLCIEAVGSPALIEMCPTLVRHAGRVLLVGWPPMNSSIKLNPFLVYKYEIQIRGSQLAPYSFGKALRMLDSFDVESLITHEFPLDSVSEAFDVQKERKGMKIILKP